MSRLPVVLMTATVSAVVTLAACRSTHAGYGHHPSHVHLNRQASWYNATQPWHGPYYHSGWGQPMALIVPPTANFQSEFSWGVGRTRMTPIRHQFVRPVPPPAAGGVPLLPTPLWPSDTSQFGVYSVRGPW